MRHIPLSKLIYSRGLILSVSQVDLVL